MQCVTYLHKVFYTLNLYDYIYNMTLSNLNSNESLHFDYARKSTRKLSIANAVSRCQLLAYCSS